MLKNYSKYLAIILAISVAFGMAGCKNQKKLAKQEYEAKVNKAKQDLATIIYDESTLSLDEQENLIDNIKAMQLEDPELNEMIMQAEGKLANERTELIQKELDEKKRAEELLKKGEKTSLGIKDYFASIASAASASEANMFINDALKLFASPDTPVLIIISKNASLTDYDKPTTILNYLNYLKDTKNNINTVESMKYNGSGKITELELLKHL